LRDRARAILHAVHQERLAHDVGERHAWVERAVRVLEDHLHLGTQGTEVPTVEPREVDDPAVRRTEQYLAARRLQGPEDTARRGGLPAAALPHQSQNLPFVDREAHAVHGADITHHLLEESLADREELL
jgi:hypothetical protein